MVLDVVPIAWFASVGGATAIRENVIHTGAGFRPSSAGWGVAVRASGGALCRRVLLAMFGNPASGAAQAPWRGAVGLHGDGEQAVFGRGEYALGVRGRRHRLCAVACAWGMDPCIGAVGGASRRRERGRWWRLLAYVDIERLCVESILLA